MRSRSPSHLKDFALSSKSKVCMETRPSFSGKVSPFSIHKFSKGGHRIWHKAFQKSRERKKCKKKKKCPIFKSPFFSRSQAGRSKKEDASSFSLGRCLRDAHLNSANSASFFSFPHWCQQKERKRGNCVACTGWGP